ncbi:hypothetical protein NSK_008475 [Nannochloropsis salina CCMP1776]|uniref:Uncharacterized protein n=1 Tax=Nannochloropsis salina CCMP1776 TaxID=1027361 RepID=A0A4D9CU02_9STRA|nr:hypothetical protein NSK_008475 [Nannochloropsis salina CCMP1776]|eukprot:TFJ80189.1 hypothetical protein NSK_008475 [Nannochloropsis salina CCMP1776]
MDGRGGVASFTAAAVHHLDQRELAAEIKRAAAEMKRVEGERAAEIKRVEGERAAEIKRAAAEIKRVEGERRLSEERLRADAGAI